MKKSAGAPVPAGITTVHHMDPLQKLHGCPKRITQISLPIKIFSVMEK